MPYLLCVQTSSGQTGRRVGIRLRAASFANARLRVNLPTRLTRGRPPRDVRVRAEESSSAHAVPLGTAARPILDVRGPARNLPVLGVRGGFRRRARVAARVVEFLPVVLAEPSELAVIFVGVVGVVSAVTQVVVLLLRFAVGEEVFPPSDRGDDDEDEGGEEGVAGGLHDGWRRWVR